MDRLTRNRRPRVMIIGTEALHLRIPLMEKLSEAGFEMSAAGALDQPEFDGTPFRYVQYPLVRSMNPLKFRKATLGLRETLIREQPDLINPVNTMPCIAGPQASAGLGIPCVRTITGLGALFSSNSLRYRLTQAAFCQMHKRVAPHCLHTIFQNPEDRDYFVEKRLVASGQTGLIYGSGIDVDSLVAQQSSPERIEQLRDELGLRGKTVVTMVSRLMKVKGVEEFAQAAAIVKRRFPDTAFLLVGPAVETGPMAVSASILDGSQEVQWLGTRHDVPDLLAVSDIFTLPSYLREGIPRVLFEAGAFKLPLITTTMPGCRETVVDGENGFLIPPRDTESLADALMKLVGSPNLRHEMGAMSQKLIRERFDLSLVASEYAALYSSALGLQQAGSLDRAAA